MTGRNFQPVYWQAINTANGWTFVNCAAWGATPYRDPQFRYDPETGWVEVRGLLKSTASPATISITIPRALRLPANTREIFVCYGLPTDIRMDVTDTDIVLVEPGGLSVGDYFSIGGIRWNIGP